MKWGIIGRNFVVDWMMEALTSIPDMEPFAIYSRTQSGGEAFAEKYHLSRVYTDLERFAADDEIEAVYIASPVCCHFEQSMHMLSHGKHVLCEKPAASSAAELKKMLETAKANGVVWLEAMRPVYDDVPKLIRESLPLLGALRTVRFEFGQYSSRYDRFLSGEVLNAFDPSLSNAALMDLGCYCIHLICHLFGAPKDLSAQSVFLENGFEAAGSVLMNYGTFLAEANYGKVYSQGLPSVITGEKGSLLIENFTWNTPKMTIMLRDGTRKEILFPAKQPNNLICEAEAFSRMTAGTLDPEPWQQTSLLVMELLDRVRKQCGIRFPADENQ